MIFKKNYKEVLKRLCNLYSGGSADRICAKMDIINPVIEQYKKENTDGEVEYPDMEKRAVFWENMLPVYSELEDDSIPSCYLSELDEGLYGGLVGADIRFINDASTGWVSSMAIPFVKDLNETDKFTLDDKNLWFQRYIKQLMMFMERAGGKFGISHFILINGLNFLFEIRGATNTYYDVLENPEKARAVMDFSFKLNLWVQETFFNTVELYDGGTCSNMAQWVPGRVVSESLDPFHLTSVDFFEEWGKGQIERMFRNFDGGVIHIHSNGHHLIESASGIKRLKCIYMIDEQFNTPVCQKLNDIVYKRGSIPLVVNIPSEVFEEKLLKKELPANIFYHVNGISDIVTANKLMKEVKSYRV